MESDTTVSSFLVHEGQLKPASAPVIRLTDGAVVRGCGIFESILARRGRPFALEEHYARLRNGAELLGLSAPTIDELNQAIPSLLEANGLERSPGVRLRVTVTEGHPRSTDSTRELAQGEWFLEATPPPSHSPRARVITVPFARNELGALSGLKTLNYGENVVALRLARRSGAEEAIFGNTTGLLCEAAWANIFVRHRGEWKTPPLSSGCLPGVTRAKVLDLASALEPGTPGIKEEAVALVDLDDPDAVDAAFLTSTFREVQPVCEINGREIDLPPECHVWAEAYRNEVEQATGTR